MNGWTIFTKSTCQHCGMLKQFLHNQQIPYQEVSVDGRPDIMQYLMSMTGQGTVPQIKSPSGQWIVGNRPEIIIGLHQQGQ
ncbi:MAG: glutaredoxin family protein [Bacillus sp. (in: firmicutes)]